MNFFLLDHTSQRDWEYTLPDAFVRVRWREKECRLAPLEVGEDTVHAGLVIAHQPDFPRKQLEQFEAFCVAHDLVAVVISGSFQSEASRPRVYFRCWPVSTDRDAKFRQCLVDFLAIFESRQPYPFQELEPLRGGAKFLVRAVGSLKLERQREILDKLECRPSEIEKKLEEVTGDEAVSHIRAALEKLSAAEHSLQRTLSLHLDLSAEPSTPEALEEAVSVAHEWVEGVGRHLLPLKQLLDAPAIPLSNRLSEKLGAKLTHDLERALKIQMHPEFAQAVEVIESQLRHADACIRHPDPNTTIRKLGRYAARVSEVVSLLREGPA